MKDLRACLVAAAAAAALLTGCGSTDDTIPEAEAAPSPTEDTTEVTPDAEEPPADDGAAGGTQPATAALTLDGQPVPIVLACNGADGAVVATTEGEVTVTLVQEDGTALRYNGEGMTAETSDVTVEEVGESTVYRAMLQSEEVPAVDVTFELATPRTSRTARLDRRDAYPATHRGALPTSPPRCQTGSDGPTLSG